MLRTVLRGRSALLPVRALDTALVLSSGRGARVPGEATTLATAASAFLSSSFMAPFSCARSSIAILALSGIKFVGAPPARPESYGGEMG